MLGFLKKLFPVNSKAIECEFCECDFAEGTGHKCWCKDCNVVHPMCNDCYLEYKESGDINDKHMNISDIDEENRERYT